MMITINNRLLLKINFIGIFLIVLIILCGNKIAPGRYCIYYHQDGLEKIGPTVSDENGKCGFWVGLAPIDGNVFLDEAGHYENNEKEGFWIEFYAFRLNSKCQEKIYHKGIVTDTSRLFDEFGNLEEVRWHDGKGHVIWAEAIAPNGSRYPAHSTACPSDERASLEADCPTEYDYVIFNSWTNIIDKIVVIISVVLLIVNSVYFFRKREKV